MPLLFPNFTKYTRNFSETFHIAFEKLISSYQLPELAFNIYSYVRNTCHIQFFPTYYTSI